MKRFIFFNAILILTCITSCEKPKKTKDPVLETPNSITYPTYSQLKTGNYWIYERFEVRTDGSLKTLNQFDSCYVEKDTVVGNYTYSKFRKKDFLYSLGNYFILERDSLHYVVTPNGIIFSSEDFTTIFKTNYSIQSPGDTLYKVTVKMDDKNLQISTPAGSFTTSSLKTTFLTMPSHVNPNINSTTYMNSRYAKNIGLITETEAFFSNGSSIERKLIRYHVN